MPAKTKLAEVFRESFVLLFERPEQEAALRVLDQLAHTLVLEGRKVTAAPGGWLQREVGGAIGDLRQAIDNLASIGQWIDESELNRAESRLSLTAGDTAAELEPFAARLDKALARYLGSTKSSK